MQECRKCKKQKDESEFRAYRNLRCRDCNLEVRRKKYKKLTESDKAKFRLYYYKNKDEIRLKNKRSNLPEDILRQKRLVAKAYRDKNILKIRKVGKEYYKKYKEKYNLKRKRSNLSEGQRLLKREQARLYREKHLVKIQTYQNSYMKYYQQTEKYKEGSRKWYVANKEKVKSRQRERRPEIRILEREKRKNDIQFKLKKRLRIRLWGAIKENYKSGSTIKDLGCTIPELKVYLENKFTEGMTWDNWGCEGWHIDHIKELQYFDLTNREEFLKAVHYTNLQPLWAKDNYEKRWKIQKSNLSSKSD